MRCKKRLIQVSIGLAFSLFASFSYAMEFARFGGTFSMSGKIESGDAVEFIIQLVSWETPPTIFFIDSSGGDLGEAMQIGWAIRESQIPVWSGENCHSACVFIYAAGVERLARGRVGLHRPYFPAEYFSGLTSVQAKEKYEDLEKESIGYLNEMGVNSSIIERIFQTGSSDIDVLSANEANRLFGKRSAFYDEWLAARCGRLNPTEKDVIDSWKNLEAARATVKVYGDDTMPKTDSFGSNISNLVSNSQLALAMERTGNLSAYIALHKKYSGCLAKAADEHAYKFHRKIKRMYFGPELR
jgi:hypothetical protein